MRVKSLGMLACLAAFSSTGCNSKSPPDANPTAVIAPVEAKSKPQTTLDKFIAAQDAYSVSDEPLESVEFAEIKWLPDARVHPSQLKRSFTGIYDVELYRHPSYRDKRLVIVKQRPLLDGSFMASWKEITFEQRRTTVGDWIDEGHERAVYRDGQRFEETKVTGKTHGTLRAFYASGQMKLEEEWRYGKKEGLSRGFYESGKPQWESEYHEDKEVRGKAFREDGTQL